MAYLKERYEKEVKKLLNEKYKYKNVMQIPKLEKIVINRGLGEATQNSKCIEISKELIQDITGQKPIVTKAKKSISNFKLREGQNIGCKVTLRSDKMYDFLTKLINISLPKIRDFQGVSSRAFDGRGSYTLGLKGDDVFPESDYEKIDKTRGMNVTIVTSAKTDNEARDLLSYMGMPFRK